MVVWWVYWPSTIKKKTQVGFALHSAIWLKGLLRMGNYNKISRRTLIICIMHSHEAQKEVPSDLEDDNNCMKQLRNRVQTNLAQTWGILGFSGYHACWCQTLLWVFSNVLAHIWEMSTYHKHMTCCLDWWHMTTMTTADGQHIIGKCSLHCQINKLHFLMITLPRRSHGCSTPVSQCTFG